MTERRLFVNLYICMVNVNNPDRTILSLLRNETSPLSGETLSRALGISRVAVWKRLQALTEKGYVIESSRKGYRLLDEPVDILEPHLFNRKERFFCLDKTDSTMDYAEKRFLSHGDVGDFVVTADGQTSGRGRHNRNWISPAGGLFFTHSFSSGLPLPRAYRLTMAALIALTEILREDYGQPARIKWPNDILVDGKKILGLLSTGRAEGEKLVRCHLGVGLNVNNAPPLPGTTCSLSALTGKTLSRSDLISRYLDRFSRLRRSRDDLVRPFWDLSLFAAGGATSRGVSVETDGGPLLKGRPDKLTPEGALILDSGKRIYPGECLRLHLPAADRRISINENRASKGPGKD